MMTCDRILSLLPLYAGGDLDPEEQDAVSAHLSRCLTCYREQRSFAAAMSALEQVRANQVLPVELDGMVETVLAETHEERPGRLPLIEPRWWRWPTVVPYAAAASLLILVLGTSLLDSGRGRGTSPTAVGGPRPQGTSVDSVSPVIQGSTPVISGQPRRIFDNRRVPNSPPHRDM